MNHLERVASIVGALLIGITAYLVVSQRGANENRRNGSRPVRELENDLRQAWSVYHNR